MPVLSATECVAPAFHHTVQQMFKPFRFAFWLRMAVLGFFTAELTGGSMHGNLPSNFPGVPHHGAGHPGIPPHWPWMAWFTPAHVFDLVIGVGLFIVVVTLIFIYIGSVLRFVLFNAVLHGNPRIGEGWRRWREAGRNFFGWQVLLVLFGWAFVVACIGIPLMNLYSQNHIGFWFIDARAVVTLAIGGITLSLLGIILAIAGVLAKDFVVPIMALDNVGWQEGWRRFLRIARGHGSEYVIYFVMKIVLRVISAIGHGIVVFVASMVLVIPAAGAVILGVTLASGASMGVKAVLIVIAVVGGLLVVACILAISAIAGAPIAFYFPSFAIYFFAGRYAPLGRIIFPSVPPPAFTPMVPPRGAELS